MKTSPGARSWIAAGVRHELLSRVLPALRHDMAAPVSVIRMGLLLLRRQVGEPDIDATACGERVALIDEQIGELIKGVRSLRDWELATTDEGISRSALVAQCAGLLRAAFDMVGVELKVDPALQREDDAEPWPRAAALRYMLLAGLSFLHDGATECGAVLIEPDGDAGLRLTCQPRAPDDTGTPRDGAAHRAPRKLAIDAIALQSLADDLGYEVTLERSAVVRLPLAAAG